MSKCENCIHNEVCRIRTYPSMYGITGDGCDHYKDKSLCVELPCRCKDCEYYCANYCTRDIKGRTNMFYMNENDYCTYAKLKEISDGKRSK